MEERLSWDEYFLEEAARIATRSKDPARQVGAVIVRGNREVARGYNAFPKGIADTPERYASQEFKDAVVMHAEESALDMATGSVEGCTIYVTPYMPCPHCAARLIARGIRRVVVREVGPISDKWQSRFHITREVFAECGVSLEFLPRKD